MAWIELHQTIWTHRKTLKLAPMLGIKEIYAAAHVVKIWTWALDNAQDGDLSDIPRTSIAKIAEWDGNADEFVQALINSGWIDSDENGVKIHDWFDYAGRLIEKRQEEADRKKRAREGKKEEKESGKGRSKNVRGTSAGQHADVRRNRTVPNSTKEKEKGAENPPDSEPHFSRNAFENPHQNQIHIWCNEYGLTSISHFTLDGIFAYIGHVELEVIEYAIRKSQGKHINYAVNTLKGLVGEGKTTRAALGIVVDISSKQLPPTQPQYFVADEDDPITQLMRKADAAYAQHGTS
jgi:hypothetical protein